MVKKEDWAGKWGRFNIGRADKRLRGNDTPYPPKNQSLGRQWVQSGGTSRQCWLNGLEPKENLPLFFPEQPPNLGFNFGRLK